MTFTSYSDFNEAILHELGNKHGFEVFSTGMNQFYSIRSEEVNFTISVEDDNSDWPHIRERQRPQDGRQSHGGRTSAHRRRDLPRRPLGAGDRKLRSAP